MSGATKDAIEMRGDIPQDRALTADDWPTPQERHYAGRQEALAAHHDVGIESRVVDTEAAGQVHYLVAGATDGEPVVLLHGVGTTAATWLPMAAELTDEYRLYIPDRPGRGLSGTPSYRGRSLRWFMVGYLVDLFDSLGLEQPHVVGNSLGGQQAFLLALDHNAVDRLCLVGSPAGVSREFSLLWRLLTVRGLNRLLFWLQSRGDPLEGAKSQTEQLLTSDDSAVSEAFYELLAASSEMPDRQKSLRSLQSEQGSFGRMHSLFDLTDELVDVERPTKFVWGTDDSFFTPAVGRPVADKMPNAQFHELENHGHMPWLEPGDEAETAVREFIDG